MKELRPIKDHDVYAEPISAQIARALFDALYRPLFAILGTPPKQVALRNAPDTLREALMSGRIWYNDGKFYGKFNAAIGLALRKMGANFNSRDKLYYLPTDKLTMDMRAIIGAANSKFSEQQNALLETLNKMNNPPELEFLKVQPYLAGVFIDLERQFQTTVPDDLQIPMKMTPYIQQEIERDYTANLNLYIKGWYADEIIKLREDVQKVVAQGYRADHMAAVLEAQYGVAQRKAKFLGRQETSLLVSKFREQRYKESGIRKYRWSTSHDSRVRHDHKELNNKIFDWDHPPITDQATQARNHPGEDFNCRCVAIPLLDSDLELLKK